MLKLLLVLVIINGEAHTFAAQVETAAQCVVMESSAATWLPQVLGVKPEFFAVKCADLQPFVTAT